MKLLTRSVVLLPSLAFIAWGCSSPSSPSGGTSVGTTMFDGQTMSFGSGSSAFPRPPNSVWPLGLLDLNLYNCGTSPAFTVAVYDRNPSPGSYTVGGGLQIDASLQSASFQAFRAAPGIAGSSGTLIISSASATRIAGSFAFTLVQNGSGFTKDVQGTFDLEITGVDVCR